MKKNAFTLLELVIVIIIIGVLASLALPRLFSIIRLSRGAEALSMAATIRSSMERHYLMHGDYGAAFMLAPSVNFLDIGNPNDSPGKHFYYRLTSFSNGYFIRMWDKESYDDHPPAGGPFVGIYMALGCEFDSHWLGNCPGDGKVRWGVTPEYKGLVSGATCLGSYCE